jgi:signal transduction histidine kinase/ActR/RegA family two-component response regulator
MAVFALREIARALSDSLSDGAIADVVVGNIHDRFGAEASVVYLADGPVDETTYVDLAAARGVPDETHERRARVPLSAPLPLMRAMRTGEPGWYETRAELVDAFPELAALAVPAGKLEAAIALPFFVDERCVGGMAFSFRNPRSFSALEREIFLTIADLAAQAVDRARLLAAKRAAQDELARANRAKDEFLATLSHELRSPLNVIVGWVEMLKAEGVGAETYLRGLNVIERNVRAQVRLIEDVLDVSRIVSGKLQLEPRVVSVRKLVQAACDGLRPTATAKGLSLCLKTDAEDALHARVDGERIQQVVANLLSNAVKFTPNGGQIDVSASSTAEHVVLSVRDTGQGIAPSFLPKMFERFRQADEGTTRRHGGLGLGLSISRHIVELHGGTIVAASEGEGQGATFTVTLPRLAADASLDEAPVSSTAVSLEGMQILLCDDDAEAREMLAALLRLQGAEVFAVANGRQALGWLAESRPDVFLCDVSMPGLDGYGVMRALRARDTQGGSPVRTIAVTAHASGADAQRARDSGFDAHVAKPVDIGRLCEAIARMRVARAD